MTRRLLAPAFAMLATALMAGCTSNKAADDATTVAVSGSGTSCTLATTSAPAGTVSFDFTNDSEAEAEFYLYAANGKDILTEVEGVGPGTTRTLSIDLDKGSYIAACKSEDNEDGVRVDFTVD